MKKTCLITPAVPLLTVTVADCVMVLPFVAVALAVVAEGVTVADPWGVAQGLQTALPEPSTTLNAVGGPPAICQLSVAFSPGVMLLGDALKLSVRGTVTVTDAGLEVPAGPVAVS